MTGTLGLVAQLLAASVASAPAPARSMAIAEYRFLPGTIRHFQAAQESYEAGLAGLANAHARLVLHDQGLKVYVDFSQTPERIRDAGQRAVDKAVEYWNGTLGFEALQLVGDPYAAQVTVQFAPDVVLQGIQVGGYCSQLRDVSTGPNGEASAHYSATIMARYQMPNGRRLNEKCLLNVVSHEFGHVFGLNDCTQPGYLMSPLNPSRPRYDLHADEMEALMQIRLTTFEMQRSILYRSLSR